MGFLVDEVCGIIDKIAVEINVVGLVPLLIGICYGIEVVSNFIFPQIVSYFELELWILMI